MVYHLSGMRIHWKIPKKSVKFFLTLLFMFNIAWIFIRFNSEDIKNVPDFLEIRSNLGDMKTIFSESKHMRPPDQSYNLNVTKSDGISLDRDIPDGRAPECKEFMYDLKKLPTISVIIPFYNEALSMLLRTVHSVLNRTPANLLADIIIVNDHSTNRDLYGLLEKYVKRLPTKVQLIANPTRIGLIRARMMGANLAKGEVLMFLDAHTEVNVNWAEPLLYEISRDHSIIMQPFIESIEDWTIQYHVAEFTVPRGGFSWDMRYIWLTMPEHEWNRIEHKLYVPFRNPVLVGCAFAVHKEYFFSIGAFDEGMKIWGGENIELSFRNWMCGGQVLTHPCSRVGHVFKPFSYEFDGDKEKIVEKNNIRLAETWMDEYKKFFLAASYSWDFKRTSLTSDELASLSKRIDLRKKLSCKSFDWFLNEIMPELPKPPTTAIYYGEIVNELTQACWEIKADGFIGVTNFCFIHRIIPENIFHLNNDNRLMYRNKCVSIHLETFLLFLQDCNENPNSEIWEFFPLNPVTGFISIKINNIEDQQKQFCLVQVTNVNSAHYKEQMIQITECDQTNSYQLWHWSYKFSFDYDFSQPI